MARVEWEGADAGLLGLVKSALLRWGGRQFRVAGMPRWLVPGLVLGVKGYGPGQVQHPGCSLLPGSNHQTQDFILVWGWLFFFSPPLLSFFAYVFFSP